MGEETRNNSLTESIGLNSKNLVSSGMSERTGRVWEPHTSQGFEYNITGMIVLSLQEVGTRENRH